MNKTLKAILTFVGVTPASAAVGSLVTSLLEKIPFMEEFTKPFTWILAVAPPSRLLAGMRTKRMTILSCISR